MIYVFIRKSFDRINSTSRTAESLIFSVKTPLNTIKYILLRF